MGAVPNISPSEEAMILRICARQETFADVGVQREGPAQEQRLITASEAARQLGTSNRRLVDSFGPRRASCVIRPEPDTETGMIPDTESAMKADSESGT